MLAWREGVLSDEIPWVEILAVILEENGTEKRGYMARLG
jgi:hypothetical protein